MKTKIISLKIVLFTFLITFFSCQTDDLTSQSDTQGGKVKFAIDGSGKVVENIPPEVINLMISKFETSGEVNKIELLKNTYDIKTGNLTSVALKQKKNKIQLPPELSSKTLSSAKEEYYGYRAYVAGKGWLPWTQYGEIIGTVSQSRQIESIEFGGVPAPIYAVGISHCAGLGWYDQGASRVLGTVSQSRRMEAIKVNIAGYYRAYVAGLGWLPWVSVGEVAGTTGQSRRMEAFQLMNFYY